MASEHLTVTNKSVNELSADPANLRKHNERNIEAIKASLRRFGQQKPIVVNDKGIVIAGNGTLEAARALGWDTIAVVHTRLDDHGQVLYGIADNRTAELAEWDWMALTGVMKGHTDDAEHIGFTKAELDALCGQDEKYLKNEPVGIDPDSIPEYDPATERVSIRLNDVPRDDSDPIVEAIGAALAELGHTFKVEVF